MEETPEEYAMRIAFRIEESKEDYKDDMREIAEENEE
jgi:hypothetical protein